MKIFDTVANNYGDYIYLLFRVVVGFMFFCHGGQKLFGWFGGTASPIASMMGVAGLIELVGGLAILVGFFTRLAAFGSALLMIIAYFMAHGTKALLPIQNRGELAILYFVCLLVIMAQGSKILSLEKTVLGKERF